MAGRPAAAGPAVTGPVPVTFKVTTFWKRKRGEHGLTRMDSQRLQAGRALDWILDELPDGAVTVIPDGPDKTTVVIDWGQVPHEIRYGETP